MLRKHFHVVFLALSVLLAVPTITTARDDSIDDLVSKIRKNPAGLDAELHVIEVFGKWETSDPKIVIDALQKIAALPRISFSARERAAHLLATARLRTGNPKAAQESYDKRGFISRWKVLGPFDNDGGTGFGVDRPLLEIASGPIDTSLEYDGVDGPIHWRSAPQEISSFGHTYLDPMVEGKSVCVIASTTVVSDRAHRSALLIGTSGAFRAYWNGTKAIADDKYRGSDPDRFLAPIKVKRGENRLVVKVCSDETGAMGIYARIAPKGKKPGGSSIRKFFRRASSRNARPSNMAAAARYALETNALHPSSHRARDLARKACEESGLPEHCLTWRALALDRNERILAVTQALTSSQNHVPSLLARAQLELAGAGIYRARGLVQKALILEPENLEAKMLMIEITGGEGFPLRAYREAAKLAKINRSIPEPMVLAAATAESAGITSAALDLTREASKALFDRLPFHETLAAAALAGNRTDEFYRELAAILTLASHDRDALWKMASLLEGAGLEERARETLELAHTLCPSDADALRKLGLFELRRGDTKEAMRYLEEARLLRPQDTWLADYLDHMNPTPGFEVPFMVSSEEFLSERANGKDGEDARYLLDSTVVRVFETGLSSRFTQMVVEVNTVETARSWRRFSIQYSPSTQRVKVIHARVFHPDGTVENAVGRGIIPIAEPWYRLYYDIEAEVIELPPLEPGDVVEYSYRVDDKAVRNAYSDYFGDLVFINDLHPKTLWRYSLIVPKSRHLEIREPRIRQLVHESHTRGDTLVESFEATEVPVIPREANMPGATAGTDYIHVSTFRSFEDLGNWYRGLVRNQMLPDGRITQKALELTRGATDDASRVAAIYDWVVTATRYVGLEFGIHGYKPYRASLVVSRGFGDCKDKASLLVTMLRVAGVEAQFALVRTRSLGEMDRSPASLSVFNHAIAYVPSLDLWLDGTAEHHGTGDFPFEDQGVTALRLSTDSVYLVTTPILGASNNTKDEVMTAVLSQNGEAALEVETEVKGAYFAPGLRMEFEAEHSRRKRFERALVLVFPGAALTDLKFQSMADLESPVRYSFAAVVPRFGAVQNDLIKIPLDGGLDLADRYARTPRRTHDLIVGPSRKSTRKITVSIPDDHYISDLPNTARLETDFGKLEVKITREGDRIVIDRRFELLVHRVSTEDYPSFVKFCRAVDEILAARITLKRKK